MGKEEEERNSYAHKYHKKQENKSKKARKMGKQSRIMEHIAHKQVAAT